MNDLTTKNEHDHAASDAVEAEPFVDDIIELNSTEDLTVVKPHADIHLAPVASQRLLIRYLLLPGIFLTTAFLGGLRVSSIDGSLMFLRPSLMHLIFAIALSVLFIRGGLIIPNGWLSEHFPLMKNVANASILLTLYAACVQIFNSLIPEQGLPFWVISFCFLWTLWNNLFADFDSKRLLRSLGGLFAIAFVSKYILLANLTAPADKSWLRSIIESPAQSTLTWLLELPRFAPATGYLQFFAIMLLFAGLFLTPRSTDDQ